MSTAIQPSTNLPEQVIRRGISDAQWRTLCLNLFPGANPNSVLLVWDYCVARKLDPLKKPCHIVPMEVTVKSSSGDRKEWRDVVMPGIYEYRTTAQRTGDYLGHSEPTYGAVVKQNGVEAPEWCAMTFYRWNPVASMKVEYPVKVYFREVVALKSGGQANARWSKAPIQMLTKCTEAAGLREAFPDEFGGEVTFEEMDGQRHIDATVIEQQSLPKPEGYDTALANLQGAAEISFATFERAWADFPEPCRKYLTVTDPDHYETLKAQAQAVTSEPEK
jgi:phage recombination protein Bet